MVSSIQGEVQHIIEEMRVAYAESAVHNYMNADYADFAIMALERFRGALRNQTLTREDLESMLRKGIASHRASESKADWTTFVARHVAHAANTNA